MKDIKALLTEHAFFRNLKEKQIETIAGCGKNVHFSKGDVVFRQGEEANAFYIVKKGAVSIEVDGAERGTIIIQTVEAGDILGWSWLIPPHEWRFTANAVEETSAVALDGRCLRGKCGGDDALAHTLLEKFAGVLAQRLEKTRMQLLDVYGK